MVEDHRLIDIDRRAILLLTIPLNAVDIPVHGHANFIPRRSIIISTIEVLRALLWSAHPMEAPRPIKALIERAILREYTLSTILWREGEEVSMGLLLTQGIVFGALPLLARGRGGGATLIIAIAGQKKLSL